MAKVSMTNTLIMKNFIDNNYKEICKRIFKNFEVDDNGCWIYKVVNGRGFGVVKINNIRFKVTRVIAYLILGLDITNPDAYMCHKCDVPACINPFHLFVGDQSANMQDMWDKSRH